MDSKEKSNRKIPPLIELKNIRKEFGVTKALDGVSFSIYPGETIGLIGPNGAGKSTLMKILTGVLPPTSGSIIFEGKEVDQYNPLVSRDMGIKCAYQDLSLCTNLKVYENFALINVDHAMFSDKGWRKKSREDAQAAIDQCFPGAQIRMDEQVQRLSLAEQQMVEISKTIISDDIKLLILDEPTSALTTDRARQLHKIIKNLSAKGVAIIYISHKLDEIKTVSDRIIIMKNGLVSAECDPNEITHSDLIELMGGTAMQREVREAGATSAEVDKIIEIKNLSTHRLKDVSMHINKGEVVGISGLAGSGQEALLDVIFSRRLKKDNDNVRIQGQVSYVSGDRSNEGVFPLWNIKDNITISCLNQLKKGLMLDRKKESALAQHWYEKLKFRAEGVESPITSLSGGNQQKALIARGIASGADTIILNDPTAGVDIETKQEIYKLFEEAKLEGKSILLYSSEDSEMEICDRVYIMRDGEIIDELVGPEVTESNIIHASFGDSHKEEETVVKEASFLSKGLKSKLFLPIATMILMFIVNGIVNPNILNQNSMRMLLGSALPLVFAALGQMFIAISGDVDMGNGYSIGLVNVLVAVVLTGNPWIGVISLILFIVSYVLMGSLIHIRQIPSIVVTLGAQFVWLGIALIISPTPGGSSPAWLSLFYRSRLLTIPMPLIAIIISALIAHFIIFRSKYGMVMRGIGNNPASLQRAGWSCLMAKMVLYGVSAGFVVLSGMAFTAVSSSADANSAASFTMMSIATVILGGSKMSGGEVQPIGVAAAAIAMSLITSLLTFIRVDSNYQMAVTGLLLILMLAFNLATEKREEAKK